ncbi:MAG: hypothetical protein AAFY22_03540 [Pseudomonadota bacterium]
MRAIALVPIMALSGCAGSSQTPDFYGIMDRTVEMILAYDRMFASNGSETISKEDLEHFNRNLFAFLNQKPRLHNMPIGVNLNEDASFLGFEDKDINNQKAAGERKLFTMEIDAENERLVLIDETGAHHGYRVRGGFFVGALMGDLRDKQTKAGVRPNRFANVAMDSRDHKVRDHKAAQQRAARKASARTSARSSARSGGTRSGK